MSHDVFISYSHRDAQIADAVCHRFEEAGIRCWYAPRNIQPGDEWADAIINALEGSRIMILIFTDYSNSSIQVRREVDTAVSFGKAIIPFKCSDVMPSGSMRYYLSTLHWMDALNADMDDSINRLLILAKSILSGESSDRHIVQTTPESPSATSTGPEDDRTARTTPLKEEQGILKKWLPLIIAVAVIAVAIAVFAVISRSPRKSTQEDTSQIVAADGADESAGDSKDVVTEENTEKETVSDDGVQVGTADGETQPEEKEEVSDDDVQAGAADGETQREESPYVLDEDNDSPEAENYLYTREYDDAGIRLDRYFGPEVAEMKIPEIIDGLPVTQIGEKCFEDHTYIEKLVLPETLETIQYRAFYGCTNLKEMNIPSSLVNVLGWAFAHTGFVNVQFPDTFEALDYGAFYGCDSLETVVLPENVDYIGADTFRNGNSLISVTLPAAEIEIDAKAFDADSGVTLIGVAGSYTERYAKGMGLGFEEYKE